MNYQRYGLKKWIVLWAIILLSGGSLHAQSKEGQQSNFSADKYLCWAAGNGDIKQVKLFLSMGAKTDHFEDGVTALMRSAYGGYKDIVEILLDNGSKVNLKNKAGTTALMYASMGGHSEIVKLLLKKGAHVNDRDKFGQTALMQAATSGSAETVRVLIAAGANVNIKNLYGMTALASAIKHGGSSKTIKLLRESGARE